MMQWNEMMYMSRRRFSYIICPKRSYGCGDTSSQSSKKKYNGRGRKSTGALGFTVATRSRSDLAATGDAGDGAAAGERWRGAGVARRRGGGGRRGPDPATRGGAWRRRASDGAAPGEEAGSGARGSSPATRARGGAAAVDGGGRRRARGEEEAGGGAADLGRGGPGWASAVAAAVRHVAACHWCGRAAAICPGGSDVSGAAEDGSRVFGGEEDPDFGGV